MKPHDATDGESKPLNCDRDAARWAREFNDRLATIYKLPPLDEGWLLSWFANAMMCGEDTYRWRLEAGTSRSEIAPNAALRKAVSDIEDRIAAHQLNAPEVFTQMRNLITYGTSHPEARLSATRESFAEPSIVASAEREAQRIEKALGQGDDKDGEAPLTLYKEFLRCEYDKPIPVELAKRIAIALEASPSSVAEKTPRTDTFIPIPENAPYMAVLTVARQLERELAVANSAYAAVEQVNLQMQEASRSAIAESDKVRLDWLELLVVEARRCGRWGSRQLLLACPEEVEGLDDLPSDLRAQIDAAMKRDGSGEGKP